MTSPLEDRFLLSLLSRTGAAVGGEGSIGSYVDPLLQQNIGAQSKAAIIAKLLGPGVDFKSDASGKSTISGDLDGILKGFGTTSLASPQENIGLRGEGGTAGVSSTVAPVPAKSPQSFSIEEIMEALNPQGVR